MNKTTEVFDKYVEQLVETMSTVAPQAWDILVRGHIAMGIRDLVMTAVLGLIAGARIGGLRKVCKEEMFDKDFGRPVTCMFGTLIVIFLSVTALEYLSTGIGNIAAPEYFTIQDLLENSKCAGNN